ncbi:hypothetical protein nbrc107696_03100 [Gordonia spumicola]|uniref:Uncharacterized protein n=1 Tax=Gordonia spumicola TaxID=589161 RepID=A0A7I9V3X2_9ACTN|nr:hypothetical protein [Gordonia spumicola]GED99863.1 hypothetical protein nbrc107696_03100 [Gordonia spumicola]
MRIVERLEAPVDRRTRLAVAAVAVVVVIAFVWCVAALGSRSTAVADADARTDLADQAPVAVATVFTVHAATWRSDRAAARGHLAEPLATTLAPALASGAPDGVATVEWAPLTTAVVDVDGDTGSVLLTVRVTVTPASGTPSTARKAVHADFSRVAGQWRLSGLDDLS